MTMELTDEEYKATKEFYSKIMKYKIYDKKGNLINGEIYNDKRQSDEDLDKCER
jgi:hypothetical protein